jgi:phenylacetic acid degradation operon negative regulatory protein
MAATGAAEGEPAMQPRRLLVEYLGAFVRRTGGWTPTRAVVAAMTQVGADEPAVRTALSRLKQRGWVTADRRGATAGYALTPAALRAYESGDEVVWTARAPAAIEDGWVLISVSIPESHRATREALRSRLRSLGFGNTGPGTWVAPSAMVGAAAEVLADLGVTQLADLFVGHFEPRERTHDLVRRGWDLDGLNRRYEAFTAAYTDAVARATREGGADAELFVLYARMLNRWRPLAFQDPGLPLDLMPDGWRGEEARTLFERAMDVLDEPALRHVRSLAGPPL